MRESNDIACAMPFRMTFEPKVYPVFSLGGDEVCFWSFAVGLMVATGSGGDGGERIW